MELFRHSLGWNVALARPDNVLNIEQDNLLRGIDKCSGTTRSVVQVPGMAEAGGRGHTPPSPEILVE